MQEKFLTNFTSSYGMQGDSEIDSHHNLLKISVTVLFVFEISYLKLFVFEIYKIEF